VIELLILGASWSKRESVPGECNVLQGSITQSANEKDDLAANNNHTVLRMMQRANEENRIETLRGEGKKHLYRT